MISQEREALIRNLLKVSQNVPTQFHLQPAHFFVATLQEEKEKLSRACLNLPTVRDAEAVIVFTGDRHVDRNHLEVMLDQQLEVEAITISKAEAIERNVKMYFDVSPVGLGWIGKLFALPLMQLFTPMPRLACIFKREWLIKQVMRNATFFWEKAKEKGLHAEFIDMYDERRVKSALCIPWHHVVVQVMVIRLEQEKELLPLPLDELVHWKSL